MMEPAALLASMAQGVLHAQFSGGLSLTEVITSLNRVIVEKSASNRFITLFCAMLDEAGNFSFVNAGHIRKCHLFTVFCEESCATPAE